MKPFVIFTNFWDANVLVKDGYFIVQSDNFAQDNRLNIVTLKDYSVHSIALSSPEASKIKYLASKNMTRLDFFCPTFSLLTDYKKDKDWDRYQVRYKELLRKRKDNIDAWLESLQDNKIYILCCWENTSGESHCHRQILYRALRGTKVWKDYALWSYRDGHSKYFRIVREKKDNPKNNGFSNFGDVESLDSTDLFGNLMNLNGEIVSYMGENIGTVTESTSSADGTAVTVVLDGEFHNSFPFIYPPGYKSK